MPSILCQADTSAAVQEASESLTKSASELSTAQPDKAAHSSHGSSVMEYNQSMMVTTVICFVALLLLLKKFAWGPILAGLDAREEKIRKSLDDAEAATKAFEEATAKAQATIAEAVAKAREIEAAARAHAQRDADAILARSKTEAAQQLASAESAIANARAEAVRSLRAESAELAIQLAGKIIRIDESKARAFTSEQLQKV
jgi:F-type H+-transporting ATPase subunit b